VLLSLMPTTTSPLRFATATAFDDVPPSPLTIAILYDEQPAYRHALRMLATALCGRANEAEVRPLPWRFDDLRRGHRREQTLAEAADADVFVVATAGLRPVAAQVIEWIEQAFEHRHEIAPTVTVIYDAENDVNYFGALCETLVRHEAETAGLNFVAPDQLAAACLR
jgi:hypothetical protein